MPVQFDSFSSSAQTAATNPFQQRQDQVRDAAKRDDDKEKTKTKPASTALAQPQQLDTRQSAASQADRRSAAKLADNQNDQKQASKTRGSLVNISV